MSFFTDKLRPTFGYKVEIEIKVNGLEAKVIKKVRAKSKELARKKAMYLCTQDVRLKVHGINRLKRSRD